MMERAIEIVIEYKRQKWAEHSICGDLRDWERSGAAEDMAIAADEILRLLQAEVEAKTA